MTEGAAPRQILVVLHQELSTPGRVGRLLRERGYHLDIRRPCIGEPLPTHLDAHDGVVIFGGPMSANDDLDFIKREIDFIGTVLKADKPYLGLCLGGQMMARHLGERVYQHHEGRAEMGYYPIAPTPAGDALCKTAFPRRVYQWHREGFDLPRGAQLLASGDDFEVQACQLGKAFAFQFHPEVTYAMICRWTVKAAERMGAPGTQPAHEHRAGWFEHDAPIARWVDDFLDHWLKGKAGTSLTKAPDQSLMMSAQ